MLKEFYTGIKNRLLSEVPELVTIEPYNRQLENERTEKPFRFPACLFEFTNLPFRSEATGSRKIDVEFTLHVATSELRQSFECWDLCEKIGIALHSFAGENFSAITQRNTIPDNDHDRLNVWRLTFGCTITDDGTLNQNRQITVTGLTLRIDKDLDIDNLVVRTGDGV